MEKSSSTKPVPGAKKIGDRWCRVSFHALICHLYIFFGEISIQASCPFLNWIGFLLLNSGGLVAQLCPTLVTLWTVAHQAPVAIGFSKKKTGCCCYVASVMSNSVQPPGQKPTRLLCPQDSLGKNTGVGCHFLLEGIFPTQGSNPGPLHCRQIPYWLSYQGSYQKTLGILYIFWKLILY